MRPGSTTTPAIVSPAKWKSFSAGADINMLEQAPHQNNFALHGHEVLMRLAHAEDHHRGDQRPCRRRWAGNRHGLRHHAPRRKAAASAWPRSILASCRHGWHANCRGWSARPAPWNSAPREKLSPSGKPRRRPRPHLRARKLRGPGHGLRSPVHRPEQKQSGGRQSETRSAPAWNCRCLTASPSRELLAQTFASEDGRKASSVSRRTAQFKGK